MTPSTAPDTAESAAEGKGAAGFSAALRANAPAALLGLGVAVHLLFLLSLRFGWLNPLFNDTMHRFGPGGDFFSIYAAGGQDRCPRGGKECGGAHRPSGLIAHLHIATAHLRAVRGGPMMDAQNYHKKLCVAPCTIREPLL